MEILLGGEYEFSDDEVKWEKGVLSIFDYSDNIRDRKFQSRVDGKTEWWVFIRNIKPVYSQAMVDAGVMPSAGMEVMHLSVKKVVMLLADSNSKYVLKSVNDFYSLALAHDIKPLDTRTDRQKTIDDIHKVDQRVHDEHDFNSAFLDAVINNEIHGITWSKS